MVYFDRLDPGSICFNRLDPSCLRFDYVRPKKNFSNEFDRVQPNSFFDREDFRPRIISSTVFDREKMFRLWSTEESRFDLKEYLRATTHEILNEKPQLWYNLMGSKYIADLSYPDITH